MRAAAPSGEAAVSAQAQGEDAEEAGHQDLQGLLQATTSESRGIQPKNSGHEAL